MEFALSVLNIFVANLDTSWTVFGLNAHTYGEYYRSGFGDAHKNYAAPGIGLSKRLERGEVFVSCRDYFVLGGAEIADGIYFRPPPEGYIRASYFF